MILLCKLINSFSACMKLLLWSKYHVGSGDLVMNHHTGNPSTGKRQSSQVWWVLSNGCPLHYCPRGAGNQTVLRTCEWLRFEGEGRQPGVFPGFFWFLGAGATPTSVVCFCCCVPCTLAHTEWSSSLDPSPPTACTGSLQPLNSLLPRYLIPPAGMEQLLHLSMAGCPRALFMLCPCQ